MSSSNSFSTADTDYIGEYQHETGRHKQNTNFNHTHKEDQIKQARTKQIYNPSSAADARPPFRFAVQQLDAYLGLTIGVIMVMLISAIGYNMSYGLVIPIAVSLIFMIEIAAPRVRSGFENIMNCQGTPKDKYKGQKLSNGLTLSMKGVNQGNGNGPWNNPIAPTLLGEWVRSTTNIGRPKSVKIHTCSPEQRQGKSETAVKFIENRPFVHGVLAACYQANMLVDFGASTSVISRSAIAEIESKLGTTLPRKHSDMHIRSYGGHSIPSEGTVIMTLEIGNKIFNTPFTITPYETATKVILGTTLLVKARMGLAWAGTEMYLTFGNNNNRLIEAQLNETEAHTMVNVNEVSLLPKETKLV